MAWFRHPGSLAGVAFGLLLGLGSAACTGSDPSPAADRYIEQAEDEEERQALIEARDEIDHEMRAISAEKDAEIERLRKENEELKAHLRARRR